MVCYFWYNTNVQLGAAFKSFRLTKIESADFGDE